MTYFFCDTSALGKRYVPEPGSPIMSHLIASVAHDRLVILTQALGETLSISVRRHNAGVLSQAAYQRASQAFRDEMITAGQIRYRSTDDALVFASLTLIEQHGVNSTDALALRAALDLATSLQPSGHSVVLIASDARLLRAAAAEGLTVFNPETDTIAQLDALSVAP